jgi:uncharacterized protein with FMN-binding domain
MFPRRGIIALVTTALALVLLFTFKTPATPVVGSTDGSGDTSGSTAISEATPAPAATDSTTSTDPAATATPTPDPTTTTTTAAVTVTGSTIPTRFGDVAVQITIDSGQITDVQAVALPTGRHSGQISDYVAPILASEVLQAQSASIDIVSGATYTTEAYAESVQSAIDQAAQNGVSITG